MRIAYTASLHLVFYGQHNHVDISTDSSYSCTLASVKTEARLLQKSRVVVIVIVVDFWNFLAVVYNNINYKTRWVVVDLATH